MSLEIFNKIVMKKEMKDAIEPHPEYISQAEMDAVMHEIDLEQQLAIEEQAHHEREWLQQQETYYAEIEYSRNQAQIDYEREQDILMKQEFRSDIFDQNQTSLFEE